MRSRVRFLTRWVRGFTGSKEAVEYVRGWSLGSTLGGTSGEIGVNLDEHGLGRELTCVRSSFRQRGAVLLGDKCSGLGADRRTP